MNGVVFAETQTAMLPVTSPFYAKVDAKMKALHEHLWITLGLQGDLPDPGTPTTASAPSTRSDATALLAEMPEMTSEMAGAFRSVASNSTMGRKERERERFSSGVAASWSLCFAAAPDNPERKTLVRAGISPEFLTVLEATNASQARRKLFALVDFRLQQCTEGEVHRRFAACRWNKLVINDAYVTCCRTFHVLDVPLLRSGGAINNMLSILQFVPPKMTALQAHIED